MAPPKFADLGKEARDLLSKNFHLNAVKIEAKTKAANGIAFTAEGNHNTGNGDVAGSLEGKATLAPGITLTKKWGTNNVVSGTIGVEKIEGLKVDLDGSLAPVSGKMSLKLKTDITALANNRTTLDIATADLAKPSLNLSSVLAYQGWHAGMQVGYDTASSAMTGNQACVAYSAGGVAITAAIVNTSKYLYSVHHNVCGNLQVAAALQCDAGSETGITVGGKYSLDADTFVKAKLDNKLNLGLSYSQKLTEGVAATLSASINGKALDQGGHQVGLMLNFDA